MSGSTQATSDSKCQIQTSQEKGPGYPYDLDLFHTQVLPMLQKNCASAGCHAAPDGQNGFSVWADAAVGNCGYAQTFNSVQAKADLLNPNNSLIYNAISGGNPVHPLKFNPTDPQVVLLLDFLTRASNRQKSDGGGQVAPPTAANPFAFDVFQRDIQPILDDADSKGCTNASCHGSPTGQGGFKLALRPATGSAEMEANFNAVTSRTNLAVPEQSKFYLQATNRHASGASAVVSPQQARVLLDWISRAKVSAPPGAVNAACPSPDSFNVDVFRDEIQPILFGQVDLNDRTSTRTTTGCARPTCHGADRTGGALVIKESLTASQNLSAFVCFVNPAQPTASEILVCPQNQPGCRRYPHPGQEVLSGVEDRNYQRILSYLYGAKTSATPLDFAFYARQINTIFNDVTAVQNGAQNRTCADTTSCHGINVAGQPPPNGSNFPILSGGADKARLLYNFSSASNFVNFITPDGSSLFLYPTNEIANLNNPFATGLAHPGGADFAVDSVQAKAILKWAHGLRPDGNGFQQNWLVAGDYQTAAVTDPTGIDEIRALPSIFDPAAGAPFLGGQWDGLFSDVENIDLNLAFPRAQTAGRVAYAVAYVLNLTPSDIQAQVTVTSNNEVKMYVGNQPVLQSANLAQGQQAFAVFPAYGTSRSSTRLLLKVFQRAGDRDFGFSVRLQDQFGNPLTDTTGELILKLSPDGGI